MGINRDSLNKQIYDLIKSDILMKRLKPGERIDIKVIAEKNQVSLMPVRNALLQLTANGLVKDRERVGFYVRSFSCEEISHIMELRMMFELHCMESYMENIDQQVVRGILDQLEDQISTAELDELDQKVHFMIIQSSGNPFLMEEYNHLWDLFSLGLYEGKEEDVQKAKEEHIGILNAVLAGDENEASRQLKMHLERARNEIEVFFSENGETT